jgi:pyruvate/2-oxoglutarate/acetoin dehydrogenase E1 component
MRSLRFISVVEMVPAEDFMLPLGKAEVVKEGAIQGR